MNLYLCVFNAAFSFLEQLSSRTSDEIQTNMKLAGQRTSDYKDLQAINADYRNTAFDRGHLNPNFYHCNGGRTATFTLTNAVPQDPCFNQQLWKKMEEVSLKTMRTNCSFSKAQRFFVTGVVKTRSTIPNEHHDKEGDSARSYNRVTVPSHMWTAVCCHDPDNDGRGFSFAYIGNNTADSLVEILSVSALETRLTSQRLDQDRYESVKIFADDCSENSTESKSALAQVSEPVDIRVANAVDDLSRVGQSTIPLKKRKISHKTLGLIKRKKVPADDYSLARLDPGLILHRNNALINKTREILLKAGAGLLLYRPHGFSSLPMTRYELDATSHRNYRTSSKPKKSKAEKKYHNGMNDDKQEEMNDQAKSLVEDEYLIIPDLSADNSTITIGGDRCRDLSSCAFGGYTYKWCYTDWSDNWDYCCKDKCMFREGYNYLTCETGDGLKGCSSRSSIFTIKGERCLGDHECGLHGESYYWCYTDIAKHWNYCCQPWHTCEKHKKTADKWCYVGQSRSKRKKYCGY